jgi:hypothetical protein
MIYNLLTMKNQRNFPLVHWKSIVKNPNFSFLWFLKKKNRHIINSLYFLI